MPGLIGFINQSSAEEASDLLAKMAHALEPETRFQRDLHSEPGLGIGRVSLGFINPEPQPFWNEDRSIGVILVGELYDIGELVRELMADGRIDAITQQAQLVLKLYEKFGDDFAVRLNGIFAIAILDKPKRKLLLTNDRLGMYPVYYAAQEGNLVFGSGVRAILADPGVDRAVDQLAVAQMLTFDHLLFDRTLLSSVRLLPQASLLTFIDGDLQIRPYWQVQYPEFYENRSEEALLEQLQFFLKQAVRRQAPGDEPAGLLLSGGLDSRAVLACLLDEAPDKTIHTFTWGIPGCDDARIAAEVARKLGTPHHFFELKPDFLLEKADEAVRMTGGMGNLINLHALATLEEEAVYAQVIYKGFLGDAMTGFAIRRRFWAGYEPETRQAVHWDVHTAQGVIGYNPTEQQAAFTNSFLSQIQCGLREEYRAGMDEAGVPLLAAQRLHFDLRQRVPRMTTKGVDVVRSRAHVRTPFLDNDLLDFVIGVPPGYHYDRYLMRTAFLRAFPQLAQIPLTDTGLPMIDCARDIMIRTQNMVKWHLRQRGLGRLAGPQRRPYKDYNTWFRTVLRSWVEGILLSPTTLERGYLKPAYLRDLVSRHMAGEDHTIRLGMLLALEIWHRQYLD